MISILKKILSPQALKVYQEVSKSSPVTAKTISNRLKIFPNAVYREIDKLESFGLVSATGTHPAKFQNRKSEESLGFLTDLVRQSLLINQKDSDETLNLDFIQNRNELLNLTNKDTKHAKESLNILVSGHEVPTETILGQKQAVDRGVRVRILIQDLSASVRERVRAWKKMGIEVRYLKYMQARILIFDGKIVYFTSYSESKNHEAVGMRFEYEPYARLMDELFEQKWLQARVV